MKTQQNGLTKPFLFPVEIIFSFTQGSPVYSPIYQGQPYVILHRAALGIGDLAPVHYTTPHVEPSPGAFPTSQTLFAQGSPLQTQFTEARLV